MYKVKIPNYLTFARIACIPFLITFYFIEEDIKTITAGIFIFASITDYLDGYLSRKWDAQSKFGELMDPIADKLIVITALALLLDKDQSHIILLPTIGIMCREIFISGLREFLAKASADMPVTKLAKWKTGTQMGAIIVLLYIGGSEEHLFLYILGSAGLWAAFILTAYTGWLYYQSAKEKNLI
jgi:CDP-diacylglycerol--glycerol-3-phosphate 3-phosphatidyltransferase